MGEYNINDINEVKNFLKTVYKDDYSSFAITSRITRIISEQIEEEYNGSKELSLNNTDLCNYLRDEKIIEFISDRQPDMSKVPDSVVEDVVQYFKEDISGFTPLHVCRKSNHPEDNYLYTVIAKKDNDDSIAYWSTYNDSTKSMNHGHYGLESKEDALNEISELFYDITDDIEDFGPDKSLRDVPGEAFKENETEEANFFRRRTR